MAYPNRIRFFRYQRGYSQVHLASLVRVSPSLISAVERGERPCYPKLSRMICEALGATVEEVFGEEIEGKKQSTASRLAGKG
ncbi:MAG: helix-turn-helix domain-containing protein [Actinobacteria bacterium]|nr:helix-turn-helix domain-containing protein [Actinomycetota bacterium]